MKFKRFLSFAVLFAFAFSNSAFAKQEVVEFYQTEEYKEYLKNPDSYTVVPSPTVYVRYDEVDEAELFAALPEYYNSNEEYQGKLPKVRNQGSYPDCWAYGALGAAEYSAVVKDYKDFSDSSSLYSEHHMVAAMNETQDADYKEYTWVGTNGGNREMSVGYMSREVAGGPVLFNAFNGVDYANYRNTRTNFNLLLGKKRETMLTKARYLTGGYEGSSVLSYSGSNTNPQNITYYKNTQTINKIKQAIMEYGAVSACYYSYEAISDKYYNDAMGAYSGSWQDMLSGKTPNGNKIKFKYGGGYSYTWETNHIVTIVGWDDNYSYEVFKVSPVSYDGEKYKGENGAWIVRNSWGEDWANGGYEYISYMDPTICTYATVYETEDVAKNKIYTYAHSGPAGSSSSSGYIHRYGVNRYEADGEEVITSVGIYCVNNGNAAEIVIDPNPGVEPIKFTSSNFSAHRAVLENFDTGESMLKVNFETPGYYVYKLKTPVAVNGKFDVYIRYTNDSKGSINLGVGFYRNSGTSYGKNAAYMATSDDSGGVSSWSSGAGVAIANAYTTKERFEIPKFTKTLTGINVKFKAYKSGDDVKVFAALYKDDSIVKIVRRDAEFDSNGNFELTIPTDGTEITSARAFIWNAFSLEPEGCYNKIVF